MKTKNFHLSDFEINIRDMVSLQAFAPDLHECLINIGLRQNVDRVLDAEFITNIGVTCTALSIMGTDGAVNSDWRFSRFGILYIADERSSFEILSIDGDKFEFNHTEYSLVIPIMACRENILGALINGYKNPFRMFLFYLNLLLLCLEKLGDKHIDLEKVMGFLDRHKREDFSKHEPFFNKYLMTDVV